MIQRLLDWLKMAAVSESVWEQVLKDYGARLQQIVYADEYGTIEVGNKNPIGYEMTITDSDFTVNVTVSANVHWDADLGTALHCIGVVRRLARSTETPAQGAATEVAREARPSADNVPTKSKKQPEAPVGDTGKAAK